MLFYSLSTYHLFLSSNFLFVSDFVISFFLDLRPPLFFKGSLLSFKFWVFATYFPLLTSSLRSHFFLLSKLLFCSCLIPRSKRLANFIYTVSSSHSWTAILAFSSSHCSKNLAGLCLSTSLQPFGSFSLAFDSLKTLLYWNPERV